MATIVLSAALVSMEVQAASVGWTTQAPMPTARYGVAGTALRDSFYVIGGAASGGVSTKVEAYNTVTGTWTTKADTPTARAGASAVGIDGLGKLWVVGGCVNADCRIGSTGTLELYDETANKWFAQTSMPTRRSSPAVGVIGTKIYVAGGGYDCPPCLTTAALEAYDYPSNTWTTQASMPTAREGLGKGAIVNGLFYVIGGATRPSTSLASGSSAVEVYDPATNAWTTKAPMPTARFGMALEVVDGKIYAIGGQASSGTATLSTVEVYDPATNTWSTDAAIPTARYAPASAAINHVVYVAGSGSGNTPIATLEALQTTPWVTKASMPTGRAGPAGAFVEGKFYVVGGASASFVKNKVEAYDPVTNTWTAKANAPTGRSYAGAAGIGGKLYVVGGCVNSDCRIGMTGILEVYDPATNAWTAKASMPTPRSAGAIGVIDGKLYYAGGGQPCPPCGQVNALEVYDPATDTWETKAPMSTQRASLGNAAVIEGMLYVVGGGMWPETSTHVALATVEAYDPATNAWTTKASLQTPRYVMGTAAANGRIYAISGEPASSAGELAIVEVYDPTTNAWSYGPSIPTKRYGPAVGVHDGTIYVAGSGSGNSPISTLEAYPAPPAPQPTSPTTSTTASTTTSTSLARPTVDSSTPAPGLEAWFVFLALGVLAVVSTRRR